MHKGTVVLVPFPFTDFSGQKVRPALVLHVSRKDENCIVAFVTSVQRPQIYSYDVAIRPSKQNGFLLDSIIKLNHLATLQKKVILGELGIVESSRMQEIDKKLKALFGL
jgi:mRNA interferase MazF